MEASARRRRFGWDGLAVRFAVRAAAALLILGLVLHMQLESIIRRRALAETVRSVAVVESLGLAPRILQTELNRGMSPSTVALFDAVMAKTRAAGSVERIKIFNSEHEVVYSDEYQLIGDRFPDSEGVSLALTGETVANVSHLDDDDSGEQVLEVYAPLHLAGDAPGQPSGAFEIYLPYAPVLQAVQADTRKLAIILVIGLTGLFVALFGIVRLASRRLFLEHARNRHQALHDSLTGLPNRTLLFDRVSQAVSISERERSPVAVMVLDLDGFKEVNDTLGHSNGDRLLVNVATRLRDSLRSSDTVSRLGGDEFAVLLHNADAAAAIEVARALIATLAEPFDVGGLSISIEASIGIAVSPRDGNTPEELLQRADVAMYIAKSSRVGVSLYDPEQDDYSPDRLALLGALREAVAAQEVSVHYQPKALVETGQVIGVEALARWSHPVQGPVAPDAFIPLAEQTTLIGPMTELVLEQSLADVAQWHEAGHPLALSVNVSMRNLQDEEFPFVVRDALTRHGIEPGDLTLEITETALMHDPELALRIVGRLRALGVQLSIDDYGTGYSSLAYLQQLTVNELKIDRHFIANISHSASDQLIVRSTAELARSLGLGVVAEGVETQEAWDILRTLGCDAFQGYLLSEPMPADAFLSWLAARTSSAPRA